MSRTYLQIARKSLDEARLLIAAQPSNEAVTALVLCIGSLNEMMSDLDRRVAAIERK